MKETYKKIKNGCNIGVGGIIPIRLRIGEDVVFGTGAVVTKDVKPYSVVAGVPARLLRTR